MKAIVQTGYGSPDYFELIETNKPVIKDHEVLVRVHAAALHAGDIYFMRGVPKMVRLMVGIPKPKKYIPGFDVAGLVEEVGKKVTEFQPGDEVFGSGQNTCAEYACVKEKNLLLKPVNLTLDEAAAIPTSALAALQGLRDLGKVQQGHKVLINGASGGVGTFAVQIAKAYGAEVTGICSSRNLDMVRSIGADHVIDYTRTDFTKSKQRYDLILDQVTNHSLSACRSALTTRGKYIPNSGNSGMGRIIKALILSLLIRGQERTYLSVSKKADLITLKELIESDQVKPVIDRTYPLSETSEAFRHLEEVHASGKVLITV
ncbi:MAG: NAD(P)-dependent alcohol dehydrogenase [Bacteroidetes bacterium]|nr:MAG: NAD(P)-dependent alcohol dehydrogenase [Bacteroidota bacterium]